MVGVLPPPRARRRGARRRTGTRSAGSSPTASPYKVKQSCVEYTFTLPGAGAQDPRRRRRPGDRARVRRSSSTTSTGRSSSAGRTEQAEEPLPTALIPPMPLRREAAARRASSASRRTGSGTRRAVEILERRPPRARLDGTLDRGRAQPRPELPLRAGPARLGQDVERRADGARAHAGGPAGRRDRAQPQGDPQVPRGRRGGGDRGGLRVPGPEEGERRGAGTRAGSSSRTDSNDAMLDPELQLLAGTSCLFAREELDQHVDTLFVDEGGQFSLADAIAVGTAARNLVLLGDPNQLPQVSQGSHPPGAEASVPRSPARRRRDRAARPRALPRAHLADAAGGERVHLGDVLRGAARAGGR